MNRDAIIREIETKIRLLSDKKLDMLCRYLRGVTSCR